MDAAETIFREVLDRRIRELGDDHLDTLVAREHLARVLVRRGEASRPPRSWRGSGSGYGEWTRNTRS
ncbi:tetratricopeptide repeat protein [Pseudonocardia halophobica]|uniref:tetratricopeptide repeat protein n=1 Tax=Pseudonocardia halophobica TaxID=29401 RepID=UPI003D93E5A9